MIRWMIFSTLAAGLLYGLYCLTLRRDRWLNLNLWYLLLALGFSIVFPFIQLPDGLGKASQSVVPAGEYLMTLDEIDVSATPTSHSIGMADIYLVGLAVCVAWLLFQVAAQAVVVFRLRRRHQVYRAGDDFAIPRGAALLLLDDDTAPYSFFNQIVVGTRGLSDDELRCILAHESMHVRQFHSLDILFARMMCCMAWFNPFAWLMMCELRAVHEFQADAASVGACGRDNYLHLLYRQVTGIGYGHITNNFQSINIKNRIVMMNKTKSRFGAWKAVAALPVMALLLMVGCKPAATEEPQQEEPVYNTMDLTENADGEVFSVVEVEPEFPGGVEALYKYLAENIKYPVLAKEKGTQGRVYVTFVVEKDGSVTDAKVLRGVSEEVDAEALRVINAMPKWKPGMQQGVPVRVQYNIPIVFKLQ